MSNQALFYKSRLRAKGQLTLPLAVRETLKLEEDDDVLFTIAADGLVTLERIQTIPPDQAWFWQERWQQREQQAEQDIQSGYAQKYPDLRQAFDIFDEDRNGS